MHTPRKEKIFIPEVEPTPPPPQDFQASSSSIALVGSILAGVYMLVGPIAAASVNRLVEGLEGRYSSSIALVGSITGRGLHERKAWPGTLVDPCFSMMIIIGLA